MRIRLAHILDMAEVTEESHENAKKTWCVAKHKDAFGCHVSATLKKNGHQDNAPATTAIGHCHKRGLINEVKMKICKSFRSLKWSEKTNWKKRFTSVKEAIHVISEQGITGPNITVTWCGRTLTLLDSCKTRFFWTWNAFSAERNECDAVDWRHRNSVTQSRRLKLGLHQGASTRQTARQSCLFNVAVCTAAIHCEVMRIEAGPIAARRKRLI